MRINQIYSAFGWHLLPQLMEKYELVRAVNRSLPCLFFGCYGDSQILKALQWAETAHVRIWWSGSDVLHFLKNKDFVEAVKNNPNISHIATVNFIANDLDSVGIPYAKVPLFSLKTSLFEPHPLGDSIYVYKPGSAVYCPMPLYARIRNEFKSTHFIEADNHHAFTQKEMKGVYKKSFLGLRFTRHDGLAHTAAEIGLVGRKILWNGDTPNAINYTSEDDILIQIEKVIKEKYCPFEVARKVKEYMDEPSDKWLYL
jgi:hypothetical protein